MRSGSPSSNPSSWTRPLDSRSDGQQARTAPSTQMLRYLRRVDDLTNGAQWRLYYAGARSVSEEGCVATLRGGPERSESFTIPEIVKSSSAAEKPYPTSP